MSAVDTTVTRETTESRSSVKFSTTARGDAQVEIKVYLGDTPGALDECYANAVRLYDQARAIRSASGFKVAGRICMVEGCGEKYVARDYCKRHYERAMRREGRRR